MGIDTLGVISDLTASEIIDRYNVHYGALDPRRQLAANRAGTVIACHHHFDKRFVSGSEFYQDFFLPIGLRYSMGASLHQGQALEHRAAAGGIVRSFRRRGAASPCPHPR